VRWPTAEERQLLEEVIKQSSEDRAENNSLWVIAICKLQSWTVC
jgi:hypothetical protein